ncbi:MAG: sugar kinase [Octadecabacter sp.]|nr:sugar kinase [Octadecabacter sp.]
MVAKTAKIGCLGEVMLELIPSQTTAAQLGVAGDTYNTAAYLARERSGIEYITVLGKDGFSDRILRHMASYNVGTSRVVTHPVAIPGLYAIETNDEGERRFTYWRDQSAARRLGDDDLPSIERLLSGLTHLFYSGISLAILSQENREKLFQAIKAFRDDGGVVAFDSNYRPHLWNDPDLARREMERAWRACDIGLPSVDDEMNLFGDANPEAVLKRFAGYGLIQGALKRGEVGPIGLDGSVFEPSELPDQVIDTTAAGDSFNAAFLSAFIDGKGTNAALQAGHTLAAHVICHKGAIIFDGKEST